MNNRQLKWGNQLALIPLILFLGAVQLNAETIDTLQRTFKVAPGGHLVVDVDIGGIEVASSEGSGITVEVIRKVEGSSKKREIAFLREHQVNLSQSGDTISLRARRNAWSTSWWRRRVKTDFRYILSVPEQFHVNLKTSGGGIRVEHLTGTVQANTSGGGLQFSSIRGPIEGRTSGGGITLKECVGTVKVHTSGGSIKSLDGEGALSLDSSGGGITIQSHSGDVRVHTSGGSITCEEIEGSLEADTSGGGIRARTRELLGGDWRLTSSGGGITVYLPRETELEVDASTSGGGIHTDFPVNVTGRLSKDRLVGKIGNGGKRLYIRTSGGGIHIRKT